MLTALVLAAWAAALFVVLGGLHAEGVRRTQLAVAAACLGPSAAAWMLGFSWRFVPGLPTAANIVFMLLVPLPALVWWLRRGAWPSLGAWRNAEALRFWGVLALLLAAVGYLVLRIPPYSNDPLEYAAVARLLNERRSLAVYPVLDSVLSGGLYAPWTHPPGFPMLMALTMMLDGLDAGAALKGVALMHLVLGVCGLALLVPRPVRWIAVLSLTATPAYLIGVVNGYVEAVRLTALIGVFSACLALWQSRGASSAMRLGLLFGLGGFVHSLGILSVAFFLPALVLLRHGPWAQRLLWAAAIVAVQVLVLAPDLWRNLALFGVVLGDRPEIWRMPEIDRAAYFSDFRSLSGPADKLLRGWLQGFTKIPNFGLTYWLPLLMGLWLWLARRRRTPEPVAEPESWRSAVLLAGCVVFTFFALAAALTLMGSVEAIKNARYILTVQPLVALVTAWMVMHLGGRALLRRSLAVLLLGCSLVPAIYMAERHPGLLFSTMSTEQAYFRYAQPEAEAVRQVERRQRPGHCALLFQQADYALYGKGCFRSFLDHGFADVYRERTATGAASRLLAMGISTIVTPSHAMPEIYNTAIGRLLADPGLTRVLWAEGGFVMYGLTGGEPAPITTKGTTVELASDEGMARIDLDWSRLLPDGPRSGDWVGVLCLVATGQGIFDVTALPTGATGTARGLFLGYVRSPAAYVMAASVRGRREVCVQQPASRTHGLLRLQAGAGVRIESVNFVWAPGPTDRAKED